MQFQVPQFIETEDKIVGPLTLKQFLYIALPAGVVFLLFFVLQTYLWFIVSIPIITTGAVFAFLKINGRPMNIFLRAALAYVWEPRSYTFRPLPKEATPVATKRAAGLPLTGLKNLWENLLTSKSAIPQREKPSTSSFGVPQPKEAKERYEVLRRVTGEREVARRVDYR